MWAHWAPSQTLSSLSVCHQYVPRALGIQNSTPACEAHSLDVPAIDLELDAENYLVCISQLADDQGEEFALLDNATMHTILKNPNFFTFSKSTPAWQMCELTTISGKRTIRYREGRMKLLLPGGTPLNISKTMFAPAAPRNLISYKVLHAQRIHLTTDLVDGEEAIGLHR